MVILVVIGIVPSFIVKNVVVNSYETRAVSIREVNLKNQCDILGNQLMKENYLLKKYAHKKIFRKNKLNRLYVLL